MLSTQAWNAFLKTLEEPPPNTIFVLATTEAEKVLPTVVDRCHRFDFARPTVEQLASVVRRVAEAESIAIAPDAVALLARHATGSFRDALGTLEQLVTYAGSEIATDDVLAVLGVADADLLFDALDAVAAGDPRAALLAAARLAQTGRDALGFVRDLEAHARDLMVVQTLGEVPAELRITPEHDARLPEQAGRVGAGAVVRLLDLLAAALEATKQRRRRAHAARARARQGGRAGRRPVDAGAAAAHRAPRGGARGRAPVPRRAGPPPAPPDAPRPRRAPESPAPPPAPAPRGARAAGAAAPSGRRRREPPTEPPRQPRANGAADGAVAVAPTPVAALELDGLRAVWPAVLETVQASATRSARRCSRDARPIAVDGGAAHRRASPPTPTFLSRKAEDDEQPRLRRRRAAHRHRRAGADRLRARRAPRRRRAGRAAGAADEDEWVAALHGRVRRRGDLRPNSESEAS